MRDLQHWKDKVELSLDGRQLFFLFFGGATLACLLFTMGVMTGRRIEARAIALDAPSVEDPLAALDQLGDVDEDELTYHRALTGSAKSAAKVHEQPAPVEVTEPAPRAKPAAARPAVTPPKVIEPVRPPNPKPARAAADVDQPAPSRHVEGTMLASAATSQPAGTSPLPTLPAGKDGKEAVAAPGQAHFTLQLSAFGARRDADEFMHRVQSAGYRAFVVASDVPGKGVLYRVRVGDYASRDAATMEKGALEKKLKVSAYLAKL